HLSIGDLTGEGVFVKTGSGAIAIFNKKVEATIDVREGTLLVRNEPSSAFKITGGANTEINFAAWSVNFTEENILVLKGGC
ncbi:MAG: hypothetical protein IKV56_00015, partial [Kiritimatiellae bacterium]|nr:hypothetical protein [Kiritimatiellia bacterium]